ncbi:MULTISPECIES: hypothetical protein [unclassified Rhodococcus (in: high G+C Gram-positive bacteria)]|nr:MULTISPECIES: hypothetical protein [unclassified Rhodococcus (in: high G+C Gram-positive bacteria)]AJW42628.1 hypothetical protein NY08_4628 [Rhodococcus sp. B7740]
MTSVTGDLHTPLEEGVFRMSAELGDLLAIFLQLFSGISSSSD